MNRGEQMKNISVKTKIVFFASIITLLVSISTTVINYHMNMTATINLLTQISKQTVDAWSDQINPNNVEKLVKTQDPELEKEMVKHFDTLSKFQPQVAQGYLFGVELKNGTDTSVIAGPTVLMDDFNKKGLFIGDYYTQPKSIADAITKMKENGQQTVSTIYTDSYGTWLTVLEPLFDHNGKVFAYYGVDFDADLYLNGEYEKIKITLIILILLLIFVCFIQYVFISYLFRPMNDVLNKIEKMNEGDYSTELNESDDEIGKISTKINEMSNQLSKNNQADAKKKRKFSMTSNIDQENNDQ
ncbi:hypothetical protein DF281_10005 [Kurthia zopfii]|nr:hypothetical protein DF281_10005 [Kurthia zopfii]